MWEWLVRVLYLPTLPCDCCPRLQGSRGQHGADLSPVGPRWAPCWPHEPCYQGHHSSLALGLKWSYMGYRHGYLNITNTVKFLDDVATGAPAFHITGPIWEKSIGGLCVVLDVLLIINLNHYWISCESVVPLCMIWYALTLMWRHRSVVQIFLSL